LLIKFSGGGASGFTCVLVLIAPNLPALLEITNVIRNGILGHQFEKGLESFAPCYSQSLLLVDFKENYTLIF
jgi:hypothetical protein